MGQFFESIPPWLIPWIEAQKIFWVATAPLAEDGHVNVSPKGCFDKTLNIVPDEPEADGKPPGSRAVWYEDLTGSGIETISHIRENGRITLMLTAFEGPPRIVRLFGTGKVYEFGTPEYDELLPPERRQPGSRAVIWLDIHKVGSSCGFSIPFFTYKAPRLKLINGAMKMEQSEYEASCKPSVVDSTAGQVEAKRSQIPSLKDFWKHYNLTSIDGLPGLLHALSGNPGRDWNSLKGGVLPSMSSDDEKTGSGEPIKPRGLALPSSLSVANLTFGFGVGFVAGMAIRLKWASQ